MTEDDVHIAMEHPTIRQQFAMAAMSAIMLLDDNQTSPKSVAEKAWRQADAMLAAEGDEYAK